MLGIAIAVYRAFPFRPHCSYEHHVRLCRWLGLSGTRCPAKDAGLAGPRVDCRPINPGPG